MLPLQELKVLYSAYWHLGILVKQTTALQDINPGTKPSVSVEESLEGSRGQRREEQEGHST